LLSISYFINIACSLEFESANAGDKSNLVLLNENSALYAESIYGKSFYKKTDIWNKISNRTKLSISENSDLNLNYFTFMCAEKSLCKVLYSDTIDIYLFDSSKMTVGYNDKINLFYGDFWLYRNSISEPVVLNDKFCTIVFEGSIANILKRYNQSSYYSLSGCLKICSKTSNEWVYIEKGFMCTADKYGINDCRPFQTENKMDHLKNYILTSNLPDTYMYNPLRALRVYNDLGDDQKILKILSEIDSNIIEDAEYVLLLAKFYADNKDYKKAWNLLDRFEKKSGQVDNNLFYLYISAYAAKLGLIEEMLLYLQKPVFNNNEKRDSSLIKAYYYLNKGDFDSAQLIIDKEIDSKESPLVISFYQLIFIGRKDYAGAYEAGGDKTSEYIDFPYIPLNLDRDYLNAIVSLELYKSDKNIKYYNLCLKSTDRLKNKIWASDFLTARPYVIRGLLYKSAGKTENAKKNFQKALEIDQENRIAQNELENRFILK
jgi:hypothetical protein